MSDSADIRLIQSERVKSAASARKGQTLSVTVTQNADIRTMDYLTLGALFWHSAQIAVEVR
jgi:hypothetical protein